MSLNVFLADSPLKFGKRQYGLVVELRGEFYTDALLCAFQRYLGIVFSLH